MLSLPRSRRTIRTVADTHGGPPAATSAASTRSSTGLFHATAPRAAVVASAAVVQPASTAVQNPRRSGGPTRRARHAPAQATATNGAVATACART